jgi:hypothetical protein
MNVRILLTPLCHSTVIQFHLLISATFTSHVKARAALVFPQVVVVAVINKLVSPSIILCLAVSTVTNAVVLPEDRIDVLYHKYDGGGITIDGPSILVRKGISSSVSVSANYYVDSISSASIDVITQASPHTEERTQQSLGIDYLYDKSIMSYSFTTSSENDFEAETNSFNISQEIFGGLTTVSLGYSVGNNTITKGSCITSPKTSSIKDFRISLSQILTKNMLMGMTYEVITDEGFLNNPWRRYWYDNGPTANLECENYPETRTSNAVAINLRYYLPYRAALYGGYRFYTDTWDIEADTFEIGYVHPFREKWLFDVNFRAYSQTRAAFFSSLFPSINSQNFLASDKELSTFSSNSISAGVTYDISKDSLSFFEKGTLNFYIDHFSYDYEDFLDPRPKAAGLPPGNEPAYSFSANVLRLYLSLWF